MPPRFVAWPAPGWIERMQARGYDLSEENAGFVEIAAGDSHWNYFQHSGLVFLRRD